MSSIEVWGMVEALAKKITTSTTTATPQELAYLGTAAERIAGQTSMLEIAKYIQASKDAFDLIINTAKADLTTQLETARTAGLDEATASKTAMLKDLQDAIDVAIANFTNVRQSYLQEIHDETQVTIVEAASALSDLQSELDKVVNTYNTMRESMTPAYSELFFMSSF